MKTKLRLRDRDADHKYLNQAHDIAKQVAALPELESIEQFGPIVINIMRDVDYRVWHILDEKPGLFGYMNGRFYMLRQVRNHPAWGRLMFDGLTG